MKLLFLLTLMLAPQDSLASEDTSTVLLSLQDAIKIALSENVSVKVADKEIQRTKYAKRGTYASLFPQIDGSAAFQRTIKKQVMYMDFDMSALGGGAGAGAGAGAGSDTQTGTGSGTPAGGDSKPKGGFEVGRWNTWNAGLSASMPLVNAQLWQSIRISADEVEIAVEKARGSRLAMVTSIKEAYYMVLLAKASFEVYNQAYKNAKDNLEVTQHRYNAQKASEMELVRAKTTVASAVPDLYNSINNIELALWQLKAVMGVDLDMNIDVQGSLKDHANQLFYDLHENDNFNLDNNSTLRQLDLQVMELAKAVTLNKLAYVPSLAVTFNYTYSAMANDFDFSNYQWTPYSFVGLSLQIPIFSGGKRYHAVKQSQVQLEQVKLQQQQTERELRIAVKNYLSTMEANMNSYYAAVSAVESAEKGYDISAESYKIGRSTLVELNDALLARAQAEMMQWQSVYTFLVAKAGLEQQLGKDYIEE